jgi:hypothetical protein
MYGLKAQQALGTVLQSSYNTFLAQRSIVTIVNSTDDSQRVQLSMTRSDGGEPLGKDGALDYLIPPRSTKVINVNDYEQDNVYGMIRVSPTSPNAVIAWVLRERNNDYIMPVPVRQ